jgi:RNA polymerase sigma-70 factor (sigma-E family)
MQFEDYVRARGGALVRFAYALTGDRYAAEDLAQTALADALAKWRRVSAADHPDRYVQRMLLNRFLQGRRRRSATELVLENPAEGRAETGDLAQRCADGDQVGQLLGTLPPRARAVLILRYYLDWDDRTIAEYLGLTRGAVRSSLSRSLSTLRSLTADSPTGGQ